MSNKIVPTSNEVKAVRVSISDAFKKHHDIDLSEQGDSSPDNSNEITVARVSVADAFKKHRDLELLDGDIVDVASPGGRSMIPMRVSVSDAFKKLDDIRALDQEEHRERDFHQLVPKIHRIVSQLDAIESEHCEAIESIKDLLKNNVLPLQQQVEMIARELEDHRQAIVQNDGQIAAMDGNVLMSLVRHFLDKEKMIATYEKLLDMLKDELIANQVNDRT